MGWQAASNIPSNVRAMTRPSKLWQRACIESTILQIQTFMPKYLAIGTRWMTQLVGYSTARIPM